MRGHRSSPPPKLGPRGQPNVDSGDRGSPTEEASTHAHTRKSLSEQAGGGRGQRDSSLYSRRAVATRGGRKKKTRPRQTVWPPLQRQRDGDGMGPRHLHLADAT